MSAFDPASLRTMQTLVYFDGPLLTILQDHATGTLYLTMWADMDATCHTWCLAQVTPEHVRLLGEGTVSILGTFRASERVFVGRHDGTRWHSLESVSLAELDPEWLPDADVFCPRAEWDEQEPKA